MTKPLTKKIAARANWARRAVVRSWSDTAGIHAPRDAADVAAVERARSAIERADLLLVILDRSRPLDQTQREFLEGMGETRRLILLNKVDLPRALDADRIRAFGNGSAPLEISARTGEGIDRLRERMTEAITAGIDTHLQDTFLTNVRHRDLLLRAAEALARCEGAAGDGLGEECLVLDLREALDRLGEITGEIGIEGIYDRIFSRFCIGK